MDRKRRRLYDGKSIVIVCGLALAGSSDSGISLEVSGCFVRSLVTVIQWPVLSHQ